MAVIYYGETRRQQIQRHPRNLQKEVVCAISAAVVRFIFQAQHPAENKLLRLQTSVGI